MRKLTIEGDRSIERMREIKFRGYRKDIGWKVGYYYVANNNDKFCPKAIYYIRPLNEEYISYGVNIESIGQYTGLKDKNGKEIYESDRVKTPAGIGVVEWDRCFRLFWNDRDSTTLHDCVEEQLEVIGNIYSNPELLGV